MAREDRRRRRTDNQAPRGLRWLPGPLRDGTQRPALLAWLGVGLLVRLLIAPFAVSADLLAVYWRSHVIAYDGAVFGDYLVNMGAHYTHALWLRIADPVLPPPDQLWTDPWWWSDTAALAAQVQHAFSLDPHAYQTLLTLKLPYLLADLGAGLLLLALVGAAAPRLVRRTWAFWMLSPIGLYASYVFGRYEMLAVVCVVAALWAVEREHPWWGALLLGVGVTMRGYPALLVPVFALLATRGWWRQAAWGAVAMAPIAAVLVTNQLLAGDVGELARLADFEPGSTFLALTIPVDGVGPVYLFVTGLLLVYGALLGQRAGWWGRRPEIGDLWLWLLLVHAAMFALATFSAHYFAWITPFVALALARRPQWRGVLPLHLLQALIVLGVADLLGGPGTLLGLFQPLQPDLAGAVPSLRELLLTSAGLAEQLAGALRSAFLALMLLLAAPAVRELASGAPTLPPPGAAEAGDRQRARPRDRNQPPDGEERLLREAPAG